MGQLIRWLLFAIILVFLLPWLYHEWYISTHCTMILGTQVCQ